MQINDPVHPPFEPEEPPRAGSRTAIYLAAIVLGCLLVLMCGSLAVWLIAQPDPATSIRNLPGIAQILPSVTPTFTSTPTSTPTRTPTPTPNMTATQRVLEATSTAVAVESTATQAADWHLLFSETFDNNSQGWFTGPTDDEFAKMDTQLTGGQYRMDVTAHKGFLQRMPIDTRSLGDFYLSLDAEQTSGTDQAGYGIVFRADTNGNYYFFTVDSNHQEYSLAKRDGGQWSNLLGWTHSTAIRDGSANRIGVLAVGDHFILFINGQYVDQANDSQLKKGITGFALEVDSADLQASFSFDNIELRAPQQFPGP